MIETSTPRLSATILLLRDVASLQVLMVKRHHEVEFAAGALVFPGGKASEDDEAAGWQERCDGAQPLNETQMVAKIAAIREAFEEAGILLARPETARGLGKPLISGEVAKKLHPFRSTIDREEKSFLELMTENGLVLALDELIHFGHWVTPEMIKKRFDTHFYLACAPLGQTASQDGRETTEAVWLGAQDALDREAAGEAKIVFPTRMNLGKLADVSSLDSALEKFRVEPVMTILPQIKKDANGVSVLEIPAEAGYIQVTEPLEKIRNQVTAAKAAD